MRIAQVAPLEESVPPALYGGTERVVSHLTEELVRLGHEVTLFASGDSVTSAELVPCAKRSLRLDSTAVDRLAHRILMIERVSQRAAEFDVLHFHIDYVHYPLSRCHRWPALTTLHGRLDLPDLLPLYEEFCDQRLVSISDAQRRPVPAANWLGTVHHGYPLDLYSFDARGGDYLAFLGRASPEKGLVQAIQIARACGQRLRIAVKVDAGDRAYFEHEVRPLLGQPGIEFIGEIGEREKQALLGGAKALLFPIDWPEPFGLVVIEALACGTPVVTTPRGSMPELLEHGVTGWVVEGHEAACAAVGRIDALDRRACREAFERRFSVQRMTSDYLRLYEQVSRASSDPARVPA